MRWSNPTAERGYLSFIAPVLFIGWAMILLWPVMLHPGDVLFPPNAVFSDLLTSHWPNAEFVRRALFEFHQFPLWNPSILGGMPLAADPLAGVWYLPNWIPVVLSRPFAFNMLLVLHLGWAGWGAYRWAGAEGFGQGPAIFGGLTFAGMPKLIAHAGAGHVSLVYAVAWTPWLLLCVNNLSKPSDAAERIPASRSDWLALLRSAFAPAAILAIIFFADVRWFPYALVLAVALWLSRDRSLRSLAALFFCAGVFLLLAAPLWLPLMELASLSTRAAITAEEAGVYSLPPTYLIGLIIPNLGGFHEWMTYLGVVPLGLAALGAAAFRRGLTTRVMISVGLLAAWWALGSHAGLFNAAIRLPGFTLLRVPPRAWFVVGLVASWLAVRGAAAVQAGFSPSGRAWNLAAVGSIAASWSLAVGGSFVVGRPLPNFLGAAIVATAAVVLLSVNSRWRVWGLTVVTAAELIWVASSVVEARPAAQSPVADWLSRQPGVWRVYSPSYSLPQLDAARFGLQQADGVNPTQLASAAEFIRRAAGVNTKQYSVTVPAFEGDVATANADAAPNADLLGELNVRYVASEFDLVANGFAKRAQIGSTRVYENTRDVGRVRGGALIYWSPNRLVIRPDRAGQIVLSEVWYPGWQAWADGSPLDVQQRGIFRSITVGEGVREVVLEYRPLSVYAGLSLAAIGWLIVLMILWRKNGYPDR